MNATNDGVWEAVSESVEVTHALGQAIGKAAAAGDLIALSGELGAGKTQFVRGLASGLGIDPSVVASPTFVLMHEYVRPSGSAAPVLVHIDAYRIKSLDDLESMGWQGGAGGAGETGGAGGSTDLRRGAVVVVEWADRLGEALDPDALEVTLEHAGPTQRLVKMAPHGPWAERFESLRPVLHKIVESPAQPIQP